MFWDVRYRCHISQCTVITVLRNLELSTQGKSFLKPVLLVVAAIHITSRSHPFNALIMPAMELQDTELDILKPTIPDRILFWSPLFVGV